MMNIRVPFSDPILSETGPPSTGGGLPEHNIRKQIPEKSPVSGLPGIRFAKKFCELQALFSDPETMS